MSEPSRADRDAFALRVEAALADVTAHATVGAVSSSGVAFGYDPGRALRRAVVRALPAGAEVQVDVVARYRVPRTLGELAAALPPGAGPRLRVLGDTLMQATATLSRVKSAAYQGEARALYDALGSILGGLATATTIARVLDGLDDRTVLPGDGAAFDEDAIVACPEQPGANVSVRWSCGACVWRGPREATCFAPAARRWMGEARLELPGG